MGILVTYINYCEHLTYFCINLVETTENLIQFSMREYF